MAPNPRVAKAFRAMRELGIPEEKTKPVLKSLLRIFEKNWELIEEENYRALADAIFESEETEVAEQKKMLDNAEAEQKKKMELAEKMKAIEEETQIQEEPERPLKRLRLRPQESQGSPSCINSSPTAPGSSLKRPKLEADELPDAQPEPVSPQALGRNKGKQPLFPNALAPSDISQPGDVEKSCPDADEEFDLVIIPRLRDKGKEPITPETASRATRSTSAKPSNALRFKEPKLDLAVIDVSKQKALTIMSPKDEPLMDDTPPYQVPLAVIRPESLTNGDSPTKNDLVKELDGPPLLTPQPAVSKDANEIIGRELANIPYESTVKLDIASSSSGEIKISLTCNSALGKPKLSDTSVDTLLKRMEDKCLKSYKILDPNFSVKKLMKDMCECLLDLETDSNNKQLVGIEDAPPTAPLETCLLDLETDSSNIQQAGIEDAPPTAPLETCLLDLETYSCNIQQAVIEDAPPTAPLETCLSDLETNSINIQQESIEDAPPTAPLETCPAEDAGNEGLLSNVNGSVCTEGEDGAALPEIPELPPPSNGVDDTLQTVTEGTENDCATDKHIEHNGFEDTESQKLVGVSNNQLTLDDVRSTHDVVDIAKGQERVIISLVNEVNNDSPPSFHYIPQNAVFQNAYVNFSLARIGDDNCCSTCFGDCLTSSTPCACALQSGGEFAYTVEGLVKEQLLDECVKMNRDPQKHCLFYCKECPLERSKNEEMLEQCKGHSMRSFIKECWLKCGCNKQCGNRVVQRGIKHKLQVFMTPGGKGWGLRTLEDLPKGAFICEYVGEVLTNAELYDRVSKSSNKDEHAYPVLLDADWGAESELKDEEALCLDATYYGNVARFINHRCFDSNLVEIPVEVESPDHHYYHLAFFTTRKVKALEELTWDYGIDFDDDDHPVKAFRCRCGSKFCRNMKRSNKPRRRRRMT